MLSFPRLPRSKRLAPIAAALACLSGAAPARAQQLAVRPAAVDSAPRRTAAWRADSMAVAGDSLGALALLDSAVRANRGDAAAWHRRGMIAWAMARSKRASGFMRDGKAIRQLQLADSSLRLAHRLAPREARYAVDLGRFYLNSNTATLRWQAHGLFADALEKGDTAASWSYAEASDELGMSHWRRYEAVANRRMVTGAVTVPSVDQMEALAADLPNRLQDFLDNFTAARKGGDWSGQLDYEKALGLFERAIRADANYPRARRHVYMALAERERWEELERLTSARLRAAPWDADAQLALGLAAHRSGHDAVAQAAFDSALVLLPDAERARLTSLARILRTAPQRGREFSDSAAYAATPAGQRALLDSMYWQLADPIALTPANEARLEFLARVAYAELRWTSDDLDRKGADTDRGEIWIRYGPPDLRAGFGASPTDNNAYELWRWNDGLAFVFIAPPTWGTARFAPESHQRAVEITALAPVQWSNVPIARRIDSLAVQLARFRATGDSADLLMTAELPVSSLAKGTELARAPVDVGVGIYTGPSYVLFHDSTRVVVSAGDSAAPPELRSWRQRLPVGDHVYRVEALQPDGLRGARALGRLSVARDTARLAMSDLLVARSAAPKADAPPARWRDLNLLPSAGRFARGAPIALVWETYGLAAGADGSARYRVVVTVERKFDSRARAAAQRLAARVVGGVAGITGARVQERKGKVTLSWERTAPAAPVALEYLTLDVGGAAAGRYEVTVEVTDLATKAVARGKRVVRIE